ncbi:hypothetical protein FRC17_008332 [Serendipita sp. 399]|nr:hypothetical protein FRC17_008332 [Serendipita sp. 399]
MVPLMTNPFAFADESAFGDHLDDDSDIITQFSSHQLYFLDVDECRLALDDSLGFVDKLLIKMRQRKKKARDASPFSPTGFKFPLDGKQVNLTSDEKGDQIPSKSLTTSTSSMSGAMERIGTALIADSVTSTDLSYASSLSTLQSASSTRTLTTGVSLGSICLSSSMTVDSILDIMDAYRYNESEDLTIGKRRLNSGFSHTRSKSVFSFASACDSEYQIGALDRLVDICESNKRSLSIASVPSVYRVLAGQSRVAAPTFRIVPFTPPSLYEIEPTEAWEHEYHDIDFATIAIAL